MKWRVKPRHRPHRTRETHQDRNPIRKIRPVFNFAPNPMTRSERFMMRPCLRRQEDNHHNDRHHIERRAQGIEYRNPSSWHATNAALHDHECRREKENLVIRGLEGWIGYRAGREDHSGQGVVDGWRGGDLADPAGPPSCPCCDGAPPGGREHGGCVVKTTTT